MTQTLGESGDLREYKEKYPAREGRITDFKKVTGRELISSPENSRDEQSRYVTTSVKTDYLPGYLAVDYWKTRKMP